MYAFIYFFSAHFIFYFAESPSKYQSACIFCASYTATNHIRCTAPILSLLWDTLRRSRWFSQKNTVSKSWEQRWQLVNVFISNILRLKKAYVSIIFSFKFTSINYYWRSHCGCIATTCYERCKKIAIEILQSTHTLRWNYAVFKTQSFATCNLKIMVAIFKCDF